MLLTKVLAKQVADYGNPDAIGTKLRARRIGPLLKMIDAAFDRWGCVRIIDVGGTSTYWRIVPEEYLAERKVTITIVNLPGTHIPDDRGLFNFVQGDGCDLADFGDNAFHLAHSNSTLEHVGDWSRMVRFAGELARVAEGYFVQTPNYWFPIEPHCMTPFFHWLPKPVRVGLVRRWSLGHWGKAASVSEAVRIVEDARLLNRVMFQALFPDAEVVTERYWGLAKSFIAIRR